MIDATFKLPLAFELYRQQLVGAPQQVNTMLETVLRSRLQQQADEKLGQSPGTVARPVQWTPAAVQDKPPNVNFGGRKYYSKQKAAYFATDGFGGGIPSTRTGAILNSWQVVVGAAENRIGLINRHKAARFVIGTFQQKFHANTGYNREDLIAREILAGPDMLAVLGDSWADIVDIRNSIR